jgi:hypothetical protein
VARQYGWRLAFYRVEQLRFLFTCRPTTVVSVIPIRKPAAVK